MFTVCPKCALTLIVTAADLRVAQGYVRCGRCANVFNALARLSEDRQSAAALAQTESQTSPDPSPPHSTPEPEPPSPQRTLPEEPVDEAIPETALEFKPESTDVNKVFVEPPPNPEWTAATGSFRALIRGAEGTADPDASALQARMEPPAATPEPVQRPPSGLDATERLRDVEIDPALVAAVQGSSGAKAQTRTPEGSGGLPERDIVIPTRAAPDTSGAEHGARFTSARLVSAGAPAQQVDSGPGARDVLQAKPRESRWSVLWSAGVVVLVIVLAAQVVNHYRSELAAVPQLNRPLTALYAALGITLLPKWDLNAYDVRQLGASVDASGSGQITVRASIKNGAHQAQPFPLLRVMLEDRFGNRIAARDVAPQAYLPAAIPPASLLRAGQRIDAEMDFVDPGSNAVGFEIDACLPAPGGGIGCANDSGAH